MGAILSLSYYLITSQKGHVMVTVRLKILGTTMVIHMESYRGLRVITLLNNFSIQVYK